MDKILSRLNISALTAGRLKLDDKWRSNHVLNTFDRLFFFEKADGYIEHHGQHFALRANHAYLIPGNVELNYFCKTRATIEFTHFTASISGGISLFDYLKCDYEVPIKKPKEMLGLFRKLRHTLGSEVPGEQFIVSGIIMQLLAPFMPSTELVSSKSRQNNEHRFQDVLLHIDANLAEKIVIPELAQMIHLEPTYFSTLFAHYFGLPPVRYILRRRIDRAAQLLWQTDDTLASIATQTGFSDGFHLSKTFKKVMGIPPKNFRQQHSRSVP